MSAVPDSVVEHVEPFDIELIADATLGYAALQNDVPVLRELRITNRSDLPVKDVDVVISSDPPFAEGTHLKFVELAPGETRRVSPVDIKVSHSYLAGLTELERGKIKVEVQVGGKVKQRVDLPVDILAYDQWAGTRALPELLAAFCMPNDPAVDTVIQKASLLLRASAEGGSMNGYQSKDRDQVWRQIAALYAAIAAEDLQYANPPASFGTAGQKIRTPDRILAGRLGTCLDLTMLFASCLEQTGLNAVVLFQANHAWIACWLADISFPTPAVDDVQAIRKRVQSGELLAIETTLLASGGRVALKAASDAGFEHLNDEAQFRFGIDIKRARERSILPLPSRMTEVPGGPVRRGPAPSPIEAVPPLPPLVAVYGPLIEDAPDTPEGRLARWKSKLLDLSLRNRLLNFKPAKTNLQLLIPDAAALEDILSDGAEFRFQPLPHMMDGADGRVTAVHVSRTGQQPLEELASDCLRRKELLAIVAKDKLDGRLLDIYNGAKLSLEEGGSNTLFLALGLLKWTEDDKTKTPYLAPLLLVPVTLSRESVRSGFKLMRHDDDALINPTLLQLLQNNFALNLPSLSPLPKDAHGVDVKQIWQTFRLAINEIHGWEVLEQVHLGTFAFTKYLMWKDLQDRSTALRQSRVVAHLIDHPGEAFPAGGTGANATDLDDVYQPKDLFTPMLADSSQLAAVCTAANGSDFVLEGPPGTGKSQTIANLIIHFLALGKTVLFVSEKIAALEVVHQRLKKEGLGPFCLELHSSKAKKADVVKQLGVSLGFGATQTEADWERGALRLASLRQDLNHLVRALHFRHPNGLTVYEATGLSVLKRDWTAADMPWSDPGTHDRAALDQLRELVRRMQTLAAELPTLQAHPLSAIQWSDWSPGKEADFYTAIAALDDAAAALEKAGTAVAGVYGMGATGQALHDYASMDRLAEVILGAPQVPVGLAARAVDPSFPGEIRALREHGTARNQLWDSLSGTFSNDIVALNGVDLTDRWTQAQAAWWPKRWLETRKVAKYLAAFTLNRSIPASGEINTLLPTLRELNREDQTLTSMKASAETLLDSSYQGLNTDWARIERAQAWTTAFTEATLLFAAGDAQKLALVRSKTLPLVGKHRALIAPAAPIASNLLKFRESYRDFVAQLATVERLACSAGAVVGDAQAPGAIARARAVLLRWQSARRSMRTWCSWQSMRSQAMGEGLQSIVRALETGAITFSMCEDYFEFSYQGWWLKRIMDREPVLSSFVSADHERKIREFRAADEQFQTLTRQYVIAKLAGKIPNTTVQTGPDSEMGRLKRQLQMQRGLLPVRSLIQGIPSLLPKLKPVLLMSPLSVAQYLDPTHPPFDLIVFDEASQIPVWDAVGAIARGKQLVVVGDPKQLPPTSFFATADGPDGESTGDDAIKDLESILDECLGSGLHKLSLDWHYRSRHESLITFSNVRYYDSRLITFPSPVTQDSAVSFRSVAGAYDRGASRTNRAEADAIVEEISAHFLDPARRLKSIGVVTFNQAQMALIESLLDTRRRSNGEIDRLIAERTDEGLFIKNLESVQGDERDVILFSITYGPDLAGHVTMNFGPLNQEGGQRRLNVAITRARDQVVIFSTLQPDQIDAARISTPGVQDLKDYLDFAKRGPKALIGRSVATGREPDSPFEVAVLAALRDKGWVVHPQVGCTGFRLDMGVVDPRAPGRYLLGVECDGRTYHSGATARDRDRLRQLVLEGLGWKMHRIWSTDWWTDQDREIAKLHSLLQAMIAEPPPTQSVLVRTTDPVIAVSNVLPITAAPTKSATAIYSKAAIAGGSADTFALPQSNPLLAAQMLQVVTDEGPIAEGELFRRMARAWHQGRTGTRIVSRLGQLAPKAFRVLDLDDSFFYWPPTVDPAQWTGFRLCNQSDDSKRNVDSVSVQELANIATYLLDQGGSCDARNLAKTVCQAIGMTRVTADSESRASNGIEFLISKGRAMREGARIVKC
jgi:hypothetical protein